MTKLSLGLSSISPGSKNAKDMLGDKICTSSLLYLNYSPCRRNIIIWSVNSPGWCSSEGKKTLIRIENENRHNISLKASMRVNLMFVLRST